MSGVALANGPETSSAHPHEHAPIPSAAPPRRPVIADRARPVVKATPRIVRRPPDEDALGIVAKPAELMSSVSAGQTGKRVAGQAGQTVAKATSRRTGQTVTKPVKADVAGQTGATVAIPTDDAGPKPVTLTGYSWQRSGAGWGLRKRTPDGGRVYVARLGKAELAALKRRHRTDAALERALTEWAVAREAEKGIG